MNQIKKGINFWSFSANNTIEDAMRIAKDAGFEGIELVLSKRGNLSLESTDEEILAINQDPLTSAATLKQEIREGDTWLKVYQRKLMDGNVAEAFFNAGDTEQTVALEPQLGAVRDVWAREMLEETSLTLPPHSVRVVKYIR